MQLKRGWLALWVLAGALSAQGAVEVAEGRLEAEAIAMAGLSSEPSLMAAGVGIDGAYVRDYNEKIKLGVGLSAAMPLLETDDDGLYGGSGLLGLEKVDSGETGLLFSLNRIYVNYHKPGLGVMAGRFLFDSPLVSSSPGFRMAPNAVEGVMATFLDKKPNLTFKGGYLMAFSGPGSTAATAAGATQKGSFVSMSNVLFGAGDEMGMLTGAALYDDPDRELKAQGWAYLMPSVEMGAGNGGALLLYADGSKTLPIGAHAGTVSVQLLHAGLNGDFDAGAHTVLGAMLQMTLNERLAVEAAFNVVSGDGNLSEPWGPTPAFASGYEAPIGGLGEGFALRVGGTYGLGDLSPAATQAKLTGNLVYQAGDSTAWGVDTSAVHLEGVLRGKVNETIDGDARVLIAGGDAEGVALLFRAAYRF